jgi:hypothetical protein
MKPSPLAFGLAAGLAAMLLLAPAVGESLGTLKAARTEHHGLLARKIAPAAASPLAPGLTFEVADAAAARAAVMARVQALAKTGGVLVEETAAAAAPDGLVALRIRLSGPEKAVLAFAEGMERQRPLVRLAGWRVEPVRGGGVRLTGEALAAWR